MKNKKNTILVHLQVNVTKTFEVPVPENVCWEDYISRRLQNGDPLFRRKHRSNVVYDFKTEVPVSVRYFLKEQSVSETFLTEALNAKCRKLAHYLKEDQSALDAYDLLLDHSHRKGQMLADDVVDVADEFRNRFTVNQLLRKVHASQ